MAELNGWKEWAEDSQQEYFERREVDSMFLKLAQSQEDRETLLYRSLEGLNSKVDNLIKENETLTENVKSLRLEIIKANSPLNKLFKWICKMTKNIRLCITKK